MYPPAVSTLLVLAVVAGGTLATYLYDDESPLPARVIAGVPVGLTLLGLSGFVMASVMGFSGASVLLAAIAVLVPGVLALRRQGARLSSDALAARDVLAGRLRHPDRWTVALAGLAAGAVWLIRRLYERAMFERGDGSIYTGLDHNLGDLPFHIAVINSFVHGGNFPPEHPELAGVRLTYPFLADFVTAMLIRAGAGLRDALFVVNVTLALALVALLFRWASHVTRDRLAAVIAPALVLFSGGFGFRLLLRDVDPSRGGLVGLLPRMWHDYTILGSGELRWGNVFITMLLPQRSILMGMPLVLAVWVLWWQAVGQDEVDTRRARRLLAGAGAITGLMPLVHAHAFVVTMAVAVVVAVLGRRLRDWGSFFIPALALSIPQLAWLAVGTSLQTGRFLAWHLGWDRGTRDPLWFWLDNLGLFIPLLIVALAWGARAGWLSRRHLLIYVPFLACFLVPNVLQLSPWIWDNIKFLIWWHVASAPLVALLVARLWRRGGGWRFAAGLAFVVLTLSGALDVLRVVSRTIEIRIYDAAAVAFGHRIRAVAPPGSIVLHAPTYNSEVFLAGRRSVLGYPGHTWSQGLDAGTREDDIRAIYAGGPDAAALLSGYGVGYVLVGPRERDLDGGVDEAFFRTLRLVAESADYRLYAVESRDAPQR
jgi:hypothetical protein